MSGFCAAFTAPAAAQVSPVRPHPDSEEFQKLDAVLTFIRKRHAQDYAFDAANGFDEARYVKVGGIEQWITIRGEDRNNPVLGSSA